MKFLKYLIIIVIFFNQNILNNHAKLEFLVIDHDSDLELQKKQKSKSIEKLQMALLSAEVQKKSNPGNDTRNRLREMQLQQTLRSKQKHSVVNNQSNSNVQRLPASEIRRLRNNTVDDWKKIYESKTAANGFFTPIDQWPEKQRVILFENFHYYEIPSYREMLATFPEYGQMMGELSQKIRNENLAFNTNITDIKVNGEYIGNFISKEADKYHAGQRAIHYQEQKLEFENAKSGIIEQYKQGFNKRQINAHEDSVNDVLTPQELLQQYETKLNECQDVELRNILTERTKALKEEIANNSQVTQKNYQLSNVAQEFMQSKSLNFVAFESCVGTAFQQQIHKEFIQITDQAADIASKHHGIKEIQDISETVTLFALKGCTENKAGKQTLATALADAGHCILAFTKGVIKGADGSMERVRQLILYPEKEIPKLIDATLAITKSLMLLMAESPDNFPDSSFLGSEPSERYIELARKFMPITNPLTTSDDAMAEHVGHLCGSIAMDALLGEFAISPVLATSKETLSLANASASNHLKKLGAIGNESAKIIGLANQKGSSKVIQAIDVIAEYPHIAAAEQSLVRRVGQAADHLEYYNEYINEISQSVKLAASDLNYKKIFDNYKLPYSFIPPKEGFITRQYENILRTVDKFGNEWTYHLPQLTTPDGWKVSLSEIGQKQVGWLNKEGMVNKLNSQQLGNLVEKTNIKEIIKISGQKVILKTNAGFELTRHSYEQLVKRFEGKLSLSKLDELMHSKDAIRVIDTRTGNINIYVANEFSKSSKIRVTVPHDGKRIVSIGFEPLNRIKNFIDKETFLQIK